MFSRGGDVRLFATSSPKLSHSLWAKYGSIPAYSGATVLCLSTDLPGHALASVAILLPHRPSSDMLASPALLVGTTLASDGYRNLAADLIIRSKKWRALQCLVSLTGQPDG